MYWRKDKMKNILCTISGGRTSGFMAVFLKERFPKENLLFCFANTGKENEETLIFLDKIDKEFNLGVIWLEAVTHEGKGNGTTYKEVNFKTMESKKASGLYFAGEVINIDGYTGGFNFQAAWTTSYLAASAISKKV